MVTTTSMRGSWSSVLGCCPFAGMSMPYRLRISRTASGLMSDLMAVPAEYDMNTSEANARPSASAIWLRQELCVHMNATVGNVIGTSAFHR